jgi:pimeloyl-ACP methyl ester carboxylesterase
MRARASLRPLTAPLAALLLAAVAAPAAANGAGLNFGSCAESVTFSCAHLTVPIDRASTLPGTVTLRLERKLAGAAPSEDAVVALAGGPGQAALGLGEFIAEAIAPALGTRDLLVFDQRGTGSSHPLRCGAFERETRESASRVFRRCALEIGDERGGFTTQETVADIEALRVAAGYRKLVLYGTSYGTKVALEYAERYPQNTEALVLDSVVPSDGPEPFGATTFKAIASVLGELCSNGACAGISADPLAEMARLNARMRVHALTGNVYDGSGHRHRARMTELGLLEILEAGDLNPALRALLPAAVHSAIVHDPDPLLRLHRLAEGLIPELPGTTPEAEPDIDVALFATTTCEESPFPWQRAASPAVRQTEALAFLRAEPSDAFYPFDADVALANGLTGPCTGWPDASPAPPPTSPLPNVPTLIFSGAQDLRTPTADAVQVAARIPDAQTVVVPFTGHSVVGSDLGTCAASALSAFFSGIAVKPCAKSVDQFAPTPISPTRLAQIHPPASLQGRAGRTLVAVIDTLVDLNRQVIGATIEDNAELPSGSSFGGLHGGFARLTFGSVQLHRLSFVPGVTLTGKFPVRDGVLQGSTIRVGGRRGTAGFVRVGAQERRVSGRLGGHRFSLSLAKVASARARAPQWPRLSALHALLRSPRLG